jgi:hypothetical protein
MLETGRLVCDRKRRILAFFRLPPKRRNVTAPQCHNGAFPRRNHAKAGLSQLYHDTVVFSLIAVDWSQERWVKQPRNLEKLACFFGSPVLPYSMPYVTERGIELSRRTLPALISYHRRSILNPFSSNECNVCWGREVVAKTLGEMAVKKLFRVFALRPQLTLSAHHQASHSRHYGFSSWHYQHKNTSK